MTKVALRILNPAGDGFLFPLEDGGSVEIANLPDSYALPAAQLEALAPQTNGLTDEQLRAQVVGVKDDYAASEHLPDQPGAEDVLTFSLTQAANLIVVDADNDDVADYTAYRCRATVDGSEPTAETGFVCRSGQSTILPVPTSGTVVKVYAPVGVTVAVQAIRR